MNKSLIVGIGVLFALSVSLLWAYLLIFNTETPNTIRTALFGNTPATERTVFQTEPEPTVDTQSGTVNQLTTRPVAGHTYINEFGGQVLYVERGTGHIFAIRMTDGVEEKVVGTTRSGVTEAVFSSDASYVVLTIEQAGVRDYEVVSIIEEAGRSIATLPKGSFEVGFLGTSTVSYVAPSENMYQGVATNVATDKTTILWQTPFHDITVSWSTTTYVTNRPAPYLQGMVFTVTDETLVPFNTPKYALSFLPGNNAYLGVTAFYDNTRKEQVTTVYQKDMSTSSFPVVMIPEKCSFDITADLVWCGFDYTNASVSARSYIFDWYKGDVQASDSIWSTDLATGEATLVAELTAQTGQSIDIQNLTMSGDGQWLFFINKNNDTLWSYKVR